jgi:hypothetical protein
MMGTVANRAGRRGWGPDFRRGSEVGMSTDGDAILRYAQADRELDEKARSVLTQIIKEIEDRYGIKIAEFRVTIDPSHSGNGWPSVNCVIMREQQGAH